MIPSAGKVSVCSDSQSASVLMRMVPSEALLRVTFTARLSKEAKRLNTLSATDTAKVVSAGATGGIVISSCSAQPASSPPRSHITIQFFISQVALLLDYNNLYSQQGAYRC